MTGDISKGKLSAKDNMSELKTMLVSILATIQESKEALLNKLEISHKNLENKIEASDRESKERYEMSNRESKERHDALQNKLDKLEISHEALQNKLDKLETSHRELKESNDKLQKNIEIKFEKLQENVKTNLKTETEKLIQRFDLTSENKVEEALNQEKTDVVLRRQGGGGKLNKD
jgi:DNA repair exonuclease SbcCD ATPase subunit